MKIRNKLFAALMLGGFSAAALPADWQHQQSFEVAAPGILKFSLPTDTLSAARPALEDLRLHDADGNELPFYIDRPKPTGKIVQPAKSLKVSMRSPFYDMILETGLEKPLDGVLLETPAASFIKSVDVFGSVDNQHWQPVVMGYPIFRESSGASQLRIAVPAAAWRWLRLTVDDKRTLPVPFTGAKVFAAVAELTPAESQPVTIVERVENPSETRLTLNLGAANLDVASVKIETADPLFTRAVTLAEPVLAEYGVCEQNLGAGCIYRVAVKGRDAAEYLSVPLETRVHSRELIIVIRNEDSPPLAITGVRVERRLVNLVFAPRAAGMYRLLTGNSRCAAPRYDLAALGGDLKRVPATTVKFSALADNPDFRAPEALAGVELAGTALDVADWKFRKPILVTNGGVQQVEFDLDLLAHADAGLRVLRGSNQVPYIGLRTSISRTLTPQVTATNDAKNPNLSRWIIKLPRAGLPITRLTCVSRTPLFQRTMSLTQELADERGNKYRHSLGDTVWTQTPERKNKEFSLPISKGVNSDTLILETKNGDNLQIELEQFQVFYPASRLFFKAKAGDRLFLYYGNPEELPPRYDLSLISEELLVAEKNTATPAAEEQLKKSKWSEAQTPGQGGVLLWAVLAIVVVGLLVVVARLLPKAAATTDEKP